MPVKQLPAYIMPLHPSTTDHIIDRQFDQFNYLLQWRGEKAAREHALALMLASTFWLSERYGDGFIDQLLQTTANDAKALAELLS
jgi:hypothetical protein